MSDANFIGIRIQKGLIYNIIDGEICPVYFADKIANANLYSSAENFARLNEGKSFKLDYDTLKIIEELSYETRPVGGKNE